MKNLYYLVPPIRQKNPQLAEEFRLRPLRQWIAGLPAANYGLTIRMFHDRILKMNTSEIESEVLFEALEELYPIYLTAEEFLLSRLVGKSFPLTSDEQKIGQLAETVTKDFMTGYAVILRDVAATTAGWRFARSFPRVICRLMRGLSRILLIRYLLRLPEPEWLWLDLHGLYLLAEQKEKQDTRIKEDDQGKTTTIGTIYKQIALLRLADPWGLGHREILDIYESLESWSGSLKVSLKDPLRKADGLSIYMDEDQPPLLNVDKVLATEPNSRVYAIELDPLFRKLSELLAGADRSIGRFDLVDADGNRVLGEPAALLEYLQKRWSAVEPANQNLFEDRRPRILSIGLKATHQQLNPPTNPEEKIISDWLVTVDEDQSLRCEFDQSGQIYLGSLVSLKLVDTEHGRRVLGVVNRIRMNRLDGAVHFRIAVLSPQVLAAGIQPLRSKKELSIYQRVLLFFNETASGRKANLVLESQKLKDGNTVQLLSHEEPVKVRLDNRRNVAPGYWCFECVPLVEERKEAIPVKGYDFL
ncbi:MAG: hypothetical protein L0Y38_00730 [Methylococcaceae bacterium]|nr:hypothetical protein [Methylococcaceae bacterium]MCI0732331.1 hypothetical protein [Methylococcaceae bacterium]